MLYPVPEVKATAVKAKAQPNQPAKEEKGTTARAVRECLARSNTAEIAAVPAEEAVAIPEEIEEAPESKRKSRKTSKETPQAPAAAATSEKTPETEKKTTKRKTSTGTTEAPKALEKKAAEKKAPEKKAPEKKAPEKKEKKTCEEPPKADEKKTSKGQPEVDPPEAEADDAESSSEDTQEILLKEQQVKAKREAHARFMRFRRSLSSPKTPAEIRAAGASAFRDHNKLHLLLEQWSSCSGVWRQSDFWIQLKSKKRHRKIGCRRWVTKAELVGKLGSQQAAQEIIECKMMDPQVRSEQVRANPDCHGKETEAGTAWVCLRTRYLDMQKIDL
ncbi:unnamed protein product [Durusdinium trenchii]|uniref:Uncharacterized protein n=1 Tax=Durusdinium trenchii TaxID=1381693 RepID=A0ABP0REL5_9DINO